MSGKSGIKPRLVIIEGKDKGKVIPLENGSVIIGRTKGDIVVQDARVSRSHVSIHFDSKNGQLSFTDLKSLNGTLVNDERSEGGSLHDGDKLQIGDTLFDCQLGEAVEEPRAKRRKDSASTERSEPRRRQAEDAGPGLVEMDESVPEDIPAPRSARRPPAGGDGMPSSPLRRLREAYLRVPPRRRTTALFALVAMGILFGRGGDLRKQTQSIETEMAALGKLESAGQIEEALARAEEIRKRHPEHSLPYMILGQLYSRARKPDLAISAYRKAKLLRPEQKLASVRLLALYLRSGLGQEAEAEMRALDDMLRDGGQHSRELFVEAANLFLEFRDLKQAPEKTMILAKALQTDLAPDSAIGHKLEAQVLFAQNRNEEALKALENGLKVDSQDEWLLENLAFARLSLRDITGATDTVESWIRLKPTASKALLVMAYLKFNEKNYLGALPYVQKLIQLGQANPADPLYPEGLNLMGQIYLQQGQMRDAENFLRQACEAGFQQSCDHELIRGTASQPR